MSLVNVRVAPPSLLLPLSRLVTVSVGEVFDPLVQPKRFESYGPPVGVETVLVVNAQPVDVPPRALYWLDAGPDAASETAFRILKEQRPATWVSAAQFGPVPRYQTVVPEPGWYADPAGETEVSERELVGAVTSPFSAILNATCATLFPELPG